MLGNEYKKGDIKLIFAANGSPEIGEVVFLKDNKYPVLRFNGLNIDGNTTLDELKKLPNFVDDFDHYDIETYLIMNEDVQM